MRVLAETVGVDYVFVYLKSTLQSKGYFDEYGIYVIQKY